MKGLNYDAVCRVYRLEKNTSKLVEVENEFYSLLSEFIQNEKEIYLKSVSTNFSENEARKFSNLKKMVEEIFLLREKKIINWALLSSRTGERDGMLMAQPEKEFFNKLLQILEEYRDLTMSVFSESNRGGKTSQKGLNTLSIRINADVPSFVASDMQEYGPFKIGEEINLPLDIAKLVVDRKLGEIVQR